VKRGLAGYREVLSSRSAVRRNRRWYPGTAEQGSCAQGDRRFEVQCRSLLAARGTRSGGRGSTPRIRFRPCGLVVTLALVKIHLLAIGSALAAGAVVGIGIPHSLALVALAIAGGAGIVAAVVVITRRDPFSVFGLVAAFYFLAFVVGAIYFHYDYSAAEDQGFWFTSDGLYTALGVGLVGFGALSLGYVANPLDRPRKWLPCCPSLTREAPLLTVVLLFMVGWMARAVQVASGDYFHTSVTATANTGATFLVNSVASVPTFATALVGAAAYMGWDERHELAWKRAFWGLLALEAAWYLPSGERARLVGLALATLILMYYARGRKMPWRALAVGAVLLVFVVFPFVNAYRGQWGNDWSYQENPGRGFQEGVKALTSGDVPATLDSGLRITLSRFSDVGSVATIVSKGRDLSPGSPGETLRWTLDAVVPRAIAPGKQDPGAFGNEFGRAYGILAPFNTTTSVAISQPGELFLSFGWLGVVAGMAVLGAVFRGLNDYFADRHSEPVTLALYSVAALPLINGLESIVSVGVIGLLKTLFVMIVLIWAANTVAERLSRRIGLVRVAP
jgi:hypothetical protein